MRKTTSPTTKRSAPRAESPEQRLLSRLLSGRPLGPTVAEMTEAADRVAAMNSRHVGVADAILDLADLALLRMAARAQRQDAIPARDLRAIAEAAAKAQGIQRLALGLETEHVAVNAGMERTERLVQRLLACARDGAPVAAVADTGSPAGAGPVAAPGARGCCPE